MFLFFIFEVTFLSVFVILIYVHSFLQHMGLKTFSVKDQIVNISGFGTSWILSHCLTPPCGVKAAIDIGNVAVSQ